MKAVVSHSGGMDSSLCLKIAIDKWGKEEVLSLGFDYGQRHRSEQEAASIIAKAFGVQRLVIPLSLFSLLQNNRPLSKPAFKEKSDDCSEGFVPFEPTYPEGYRRFEGDQNLSEQARVFPEMRFQKRSNALVDHTRPIVGLNTLVPGRNGLFAWHAALVAHQLGATEVYMGVMELESANSGYRDCSRSYMDLVQQILRLDLADPEFTIVTPLVYMTKPQSLELASSLGVLDFLLQETVTCYEGLKGQGCTICPACKLKNEGIALYSKPSVTVK